MTLNFIKIFAFIDPLKLLNGVIPAGMTQDVINSYKNAGV